jgi:hypothetical protein
MLAYFNEAWQSADILRIVGKGGTNLNGKVLRLQDPDVVDSDKIIDITRVVQVPALVAVLHRVLRWCLVKPATRRRLLW